MKIELFYYWYAPAWGKEGGELEIQTIDYRPATSCIADRVFIKSAEVEIPDCEALTREEIAKKVVAGLQVQKQELLAEMHQKIAAIDDRIQQMRCLTFVPDAEEQVRNHAESIDEA